MASQPPKPSSILTSSSKYTINISPPLLNSANPWATTKQDLKALYDCPYTGAVTIRTSLWKGFTQHPSTHQHTFFSVTTGHATAKINTDLPEGRGEILDAQSSSLNTLGYSPILFEQYIDMLVRMSENGELTAGKYKPFIVSVTGTAIEVAMCYQALTEKQSVSSTENPALNLMMEINLSCPNIPDYPPPAYDGEALRSYIIAISQVREIMRKEEGRSERIVHVGIKTPPYTHTAQFQTLISVLAEFTKLPGGCPISFITATNTLGSCLVLNSENEPALGSANGTGIGGLAGDALHPLALGNVKTIRTMLDASPHPELHRIAIIGVGGVSDAGGFKRMKRVGASAVGVGTALGREGVMIFEKITMGLSPTDLM